MILIRAAFETVEIFFLRNPFCMTITEDDVAAGIAMIVTGVGIVIIFARGIQAAANYRLIIRIINNPDVRCAPGLPFDVGHD